MNAACLKERDRATQETTFTPVVAVRLQHELENATTNVKHLLDNVVEWKGQIRDLKDDKEQLQKQLELVTLKLPAPKEGFRARVFGRKKKEEIKQ